MVHQAKVLAPNPNDPSSMPGTHMVERQPIPASCLVTSTYMSRHVGPYPPRQVNKTRFKVYFLVSLLILGWHCRAHESIHLEVTDPRLILVHRQQSEQPPVSLGTGGAEVPRHSLLSPKTPITEKHLRGYQLPERDTVMSGSTHLMAK